jgi:hypothetical protein
MPDNNANKPNNERHWVTMIVLLGSFGGLITLAVVIVVCSATDNPERSKNAQTLFTALLPVFGTWVGTLLAFYFSKDNFEAASKSMIDMADKVAGVDERLKQIPVREKMRALKDITNWPIKPGEEDKSKLNELFVRFARLDRIPMINDNGCIIYLVYKNMLNQFLSQIALNPAKLPNKNATDATFKDVLDSDPKLKDVFQKSFGFVSEDATLADAKRTMETVAKMTPCNDVFVTKTGQKDEPIIGWITDNTIAENLKV